MALIPCETTLARVRTSSKLSQSRNCTPNDMSRTIDSSASERAFHADRRRVAAPGSSIPPSCPRGCSAGRAAPRSRPTQKCLSATASGSRGDAPQRPLLLHCGPASTASSSPQMSSSMNCRAPTADLGLDRIKPIVKKVGRRRGFRLQGIRLRGNARHGVVSSPTR